MSVCFKLPTEESGVRVQFKQQLKDKITLIRKHKVSNPHTDIHTYFVNYSEDARHSIVSNFLLILLRIGKIN